MLLTFYMELARPISYLMRTMYTILCVEYAPGYSTFRIAVTKAEMARCAVMCVWCVCVVCTHTHSIRTHHTRVCAYYIYTHICVYMHIYIIYVYICTYIYIIYIYI
jgi:hypothetical protein